jgi:predicted RNase H-like HicB family nuclease
VSAAEIIKELPKLTEAERRAVLNKLRELLRIDDDRWEELLNDPRPRPKLESFVRESAEEGQTMKYHVTLVESDEGFAVWCDDLPGCNSQGGTREEALQNIRAAITEYLAAQPEIEERFGVKVQRTEVSV